MMQYFFQLRAADGGGAILDHRRKWFSDSFEAREYAWSYAFQWHEDWGDIFCEWWPTEHPRARKTLYCPPF